MKYLLCGLLFISLATVPSFATRKTKEYAPLRSQILTARNVLLVGGPPDVLDKAHDELTKWGRFQIVSEPDAADVVLRFWYESEPGAAGYHSESFTIIDAKTKDVLYEDARAYSPPSGAAPIAIAAFRHYSMARAMLRELRKRIDTAERSKR